jgi:hypothetical protein
MAVLAGREAAAGADDTRRGTRRVGKQRLRIQLHP